MRGPKDAAMAILSKMEEEPDKGSYLDLGEEEMEGEEGEGYSYSDEQMAMAEELVDALGSGDAESVLEAIHGIMMSYMD
jgi:hypothetical protein